MSPSPGHLKDSLRIVWHLTYWCNYSCSYCPVLVFKERSPGKKVQAHAFDYYPVATWLEAIKRFPQQQIYLRLTGGEPFLDRKNFRELLTGLSEMKHIRVGIDTNGYWDPSYFDALDKSNIFLNIGCHVTQVEFPAYFKRLLAIRDAGFSVAMVNFVLSPENMDTFEGAFSQLEAAGFCVNAAPMIQSGLYLGRSERTDRELDFMVRYNTPLDLHFKLLQPATKGRLCIYPAMTYYLRHDGQINVSCMEHHQDLFKDGPPALPKAAVPCPNKQCESCLEMYRGLIDEPLNPEPLPLFTLEDYAGEFSEYRRHNPLEDPDFRKRTVTSLRAQLEAKREKDEAAVALVNLSPVAAQPQADGIFGYVDAHDDRFYIEARSRDRVWISGWAASASHGAPVREVKLKVQGHELAVIRDFYPRPDVATHFGRASLLHSGWKALVYLPALRPGSYELTVEATDGGGVPGTLPPWPLHITE